MLTHDRPEVDAWEAITLQADPTYQLSVEDMLTRLGEFKPPARRGKALWLGIAAVAIAGGAFALLPTERSAGNGATPAPAASTAAPEPQPAARVDLAIAPWGEVVVDGEPKGISPPLESIELLPGHHEVEIRNGQSEPHRLTLELGAGDTYKIKHKFK